MKIQLIIKEKQKVGTIRFIEKFLLFPKVLENKNGLTFLRWLETAQWTQRLNYDPYEYGSGYVWEDISWEDVG